jgi:hypothetical protein
MKRVLTGSFLAAAFAVGLSAQTTPPQTTPPPTTPPSSPTSPMQDREASSKNVTVTGCLKAGDTADSFTLSDLKFGGSKASGAVGTSGAAPPAALASATTLTIKPSGSTKLAEHVGHQVEISGSVADSKAPSTPADPAARPSASASGPTIEARSVRMVSDKCSGQ